MHFAFRDVNEAFRSLVKYFDGDHDIVRRPSRNGDVLMIDEPVIITYREPNRRVLFNSARDCNPFFHLFESIWMLAGCNDVKSLGHFNSNIGNYSDDGITFHGAYGYRWRKWFGYDQLTDIVNQLREDPNSRRVVLQMWDATVEPPHADTDISDPYQATQGGKDVPCNSHAYFSIRCDVENPDNREFRYLDITVCNRSNDLIWGALGANVVHFSFLQEVLADMIGIKTGRYHQITNNLHVYTAKWEPKKYLADSTETMSEQPLPISAGDNFLGSCERFVDYGCFDSMSHRYIRDVVGPMVYAFNHHKNRDYDAAVSSLGGVACTHWRYAGLDWIEKRRKLWEAKQLAN